MELLTELALEDKFINVTLKKTVDWVELKKATPRSRTHELAREPVSKK